MNVIVGKPDHGEEAVQDRDHEAELRRRTVKWGSIVPVWLFFYVFILLQGPTPIGEPFHGGAGSIAATVRLVSALHAFCPADGHSVSGNVWKPRD